METNQTADINKSEEEQDRGVTFHAEEYSGPDKKQKLKDTIDQ